MQCILRRQLLIQYSALGSLFMSLRRAQRFCSTASDLASWRSAHSITDLVTVQR